MQLLYRKTGNDTIGTYLVVYCCFNVSVNTRYLIGLVPEMVNVLEF